jgi:hypothetical protein
MDRADGINQHTELSTGTDIMAKGDKMATAAPTFANVLTLGTTCWMACLQRI